MMNLRIVVGFCRCLIPCRIRQISRRSKIRIAFLVMNPSMWRFDSLYAKLCNKKSFELLLIAAPRVNQRRDAILREQDEIVSFFSQKGLGALKSIDAASGKCISLGRLRVDVIFYTQPYDGLIPPQLEYWHNLSSLICYVPYGFQLSKVKWNWDNALQNHAWRHYLPLPYQVELCKCVSRIYALNAVPVGYFFEEEYRDALTDRARLDKVWRDDKRKRVIWAPHKSVLEAESFRVSSFLDICEDMRKLRDEYRDRVVFAFKPHPMLFDCLCQIWGHERTDAYYRDWDSAGNSFVDNGAFVELFAGSDAMVHCSGSFIIDYLYTGKPVQYVYCKNRKAPDLGEIGDAGLSAHYSAHGVDDIRNFIEEVVLSGHDTMQDQRRAVYDRYLKSPNGKTFSENVVEDILNGLGK